MCTCIGRPDKRVHLPSAASLAAAGFVPVVDGVVKQLVDFKLEITKVFWFFFSKKNKKKHFFFKKEAKTFVYWFPGARRLTPPNSQSFPRGSSAPASDPASAPANCPSRPRPPAACWRPWRTGSPGTTPPPRRAAVTMR